jgi:hypothetical protein
MNSHPERLSGDAYIIVEDDCLNDYGFVDKSINEILVPFVAKGRNIIKFLVLSLNQENFLSYSPSIDKLQGLIDEISVLESGSGQERTLIFVQGKSNDEDNQTRSYFPQLYNNILQENWKIELWSWKDAVINESVQNLQLIYFDSFYFYYFEDNLNELLTEKNRQRGSIGGSFLSSSPSSLKIEEYSDNDEVTSTSTLVCLYSFLSHYSNSI